MTDDRPDDYDLAEEPERSRGAPPPLPYASGASAGGGHAPLDYAGSRTQPVMDNTGRAGAASKLLLAYAGLTVLAALVGLAAAVLVPEFRGNAPAAAGPSPAFWAVVAVNTIVGLVSLVVLILAVVFYMMWQHRAVSNANALGGHTTDSPGWSVGWWFIPVMHMIRPHRVLTELWDASAGVGGVAPNPERATESNPGGTVYKLWLTWWVLFLIGFSLGLFFVFSGDPGNLTGLFWFNQVLSLVSTVVFLAFLILLSRYVGRVQEAQAA